MDSGGSLLKMVESIMYTSLNMGRVLVFEAMFTPQLHQKRKKWHDGSVKFYEANKQLVVVDEERLVVGKCFWNREQAPREGTTTQIDRVLVEIGSLLHINESVQAPTQPPQKPSQRAHNWGPSIDEVLRNLHQPQPQVPLPKSARVSINQTSPHVPTESIEAATSEQDTFGDSEPDRYTSERSTSDQEGEVTLPVPVTGFAEPELEPEPEPEITGTNTLTAPRKSPFENMPANPPDTGPWTKEAYLLFAWNPPVVKSEPS